MLVSLLFKKVLSASIYGHFTATKGFRSQCHVLLVLMEGALNGAIKGTFKGKFERHSSLVKFVAGIRCEAPYVALLIKGIQTTPGGITRGENLSGAFRSSVRTR